MRADRQRYIYAHAYEYIGKRMKIYIYIYAGVVMAVHPRKSVEAVGVVGKQQEVARDFPDSGSRQRLEMFPFLFGHLFGVVSVNRFSRSTAIFESFTCPCVSSPVLWRWIREEQSCCQATASTPVNNL